MGAAAPRVLPLVSLDPPMTLGTSSFVDDVLRRCGGRNPFAVRTAAVIQLSRESLLSTEVDLVIPLLDDPDDMARVGTLFAPDVELLRVDPDLLARPGPRLLAGAEQVCARLAVMR